MGSHNDILGNTCGNRVSSIEVLIAAFLCCVQVMKSMGLPVKKIAFYTRSGPPQQRKLYYSAHNCYQ